MKISTAIMVGMMIAGAGLRCAAQVNVRVCMTSQEIERLCGTTNVKLVFVNGGQLYYVDFSQSDPRITRIASVQGCVAPVISPDGALVAYAVTGTPVEYLTPASASWVCECSAAAKPFKAADPAFVPRFVNSATKPTLIYSTCGKRIRAATCIWDGCGKVVERSVDGGVAGPELTVWDKGSYFGGISYDNRYVSSDESTAGAFLLDLKGASGRPDTLHTFRVKKNATGADTSIAVQVCNLSHSPSRIFTGTVLYLDFSSSAFAQAGCSLPAGFNRDWGIHQRIFLTRADGAIVRYFDLPAFVPPGQPTGTGEIVDRQWEFSEWSNHPYFAVASVMTSRRWRTTSWETLAQNEQLFCINLKDSTYHKLVETTDSSRTSTTNMLWPWLWVKLPAGFSEDSTWLNRASAVRLEQSRGAYRGALRLSGGTLQWEYPIDRVCLFTAQGKIIFSTSGGQKRVFALHSILPQRLGHGCFIVQTVSNTGTQQQQDRILIVN